MDVQLFPSASLAPQAFALALAHTGTFYDALYVALAEQQDLKVLTADERMVNAFARLGRTLPLRHLPL
jgi:predicted nucleic acid-binding protein